MPETTEPETRKRTPVPDQGMVEIEGNVVGPMNIDINRAVSRDTSDKADLAARAVILACRRLAGNRWAHFRLEHFLRGVGRLSKRDLDDFVKGHGAQLIGRDERGPIYAVNDTFVQHWYERWPRREHNDTRGAKR